MDDLLITRDVIDGHVLLRAAGELNALNVQLFTDAIRHATEETGVQRFIVDVGDLGLVDSTGLGALVSEHKNAAAHGGYIRLLNMRAGLLEALYTTRLDALFPRYLTVQDAIAGVARHPSGAMVEPEGLPEEPPEEES
jgi:anti-sigma B factor antagonist